MSQPKGKFADISLKDGVVKQGKTSGPVAGASARVEAAADIQRRFTVGGVLLGGVLFGKKKLSGHVYLTIEHTGYSILAEVPVKQEKQAREFANLINNAARA